MGRDNTGKKQEEANLARKNTLEDADRAAREKAVSNETSAVDRLEANPGLGPEYLAGAHARNAALIGGSYADAEDQIKRNAATQGHSADDAGLYPQLQEMAASKARMATGTDLDADLRDQEERLTTRRMIPGLLSGVPNIYNTSAGQQGQSQTSLIGSRMDADSKPTFLQSLALAGVQAAGSAAGGYMSNPNH